VVRKVLWSLPTLSNGGENYPRSFRDCGSPYARRFVAIGNSIHQRLLKPTHDWLMKILGSIPSDGTFDQTRPLDCMKNVTDVYSFDLKSATDRWPLTLLTALMTLLTSSRSLASAVAQTVLAFNTFVIDKPRVRKRKVLTFTAGQPLGYYGPWPLFTLSHHKVVWLAADRVYPKKAFWNYVG
jgi:Mitovirus RNA-dependent RNA polymerase